MGGDLDRGREEGTAGQAGAGPHAEPQRWLPRLLKGLDEQLSAAAALEAMSVRQHALLAEGRVDEAMPILAEREPLVDTVTRLAGELEPFTRELGSMLSHLGAGDRAAVIDRVERLDAMVEGINARDAEDARRLDALRDGIAAELAAVQRGRGAMAAYGAAAGEGAGGLGAAGGEHAGGGGPRFQDREG